MSSEEKKRSHRTFGLSLSKTEDAELIAYLDSFPKGAVSKVLRDMVKEYMQEHGMREIERRHAPALPVDFSDIKHMLDQIIGMLRSGHDVTMVTRDEHGRENKVNLRGDTLSMVQNNVFNDEDE